MVYFSYLEALGLVETGDIEDWYSQLILILSTILNLIIMLNLLIAIISDIYTQVASTQEEYSYKEKCSIISDVRSIPIFRLWIKPRPACTYMFVALTEDLGNDKETTIDTISQKLDKLHEKIEDLTDLIVKQNATQEKETALKGEDECVTSDEDSKEGIHDTISAEAEAMVETIQ